MADALLERLHISPEECLEIVRQMTEDMDLDIENKSCCFKMLNTYVRKLPSGKEKGKYMAIDIGGTNLRVQMFSCDQSCVMVANQKFVMSHEIKNSNKDKLFGYIADCTKEFLLSENKNTTNHSPIPMGFTFSFPVKQGGIKSGVLLRWTKEMDVEGVVGGDVVAMLEEAFKQRKLNIRLEAMVNDTVGTLVSSAFEDHNTYVGLINGTGSNICYMDFKQQMILNMEFGSYGTGPRGCLHKYLTEIDELIDQESLNPGEQIIEKTISGKYMGEVLRQLLVKMVSYGLLFKELKEGWKEGWKETNGAKRIKISKNGGSTKNGGGVGGKEEKDDGGEMGLFKQYALSCDMMAMIESELASSITNTVEVLRSLGVAGAKEGDVREVGRLCRVVSARAAMLLAAGVSAAILKVDRPKVTVAYDGSVLKNYPLFKERVLKQINQNLHDKIEVTLKLSEDGSGRGAALVAASNPSE